ncbi:MAG: TetR/AcrR family transcriptional regulator [Desulfobacula sp.]|nr:TetR/AcrR family transcriptional regulator [Desulfobacula sp.]
MKSSKNQITEVNRGRILESGRRLILEQGIDALSVRKLAGESGLALRTIYNLYGNKENVLVALFESGTRDLDDAMVRLETAMTRGTWETDFYLNWLKQVEPMFLENQAIIKPAVIAGFFPMSPTSKRAEELHGRRIQRLKKVLALAARKDLIWKDLDLDVSARLLYLNYFNVVVQWAKGELDDRGLVIHGRYAILTILHTLINEPDRRENTLNLLRSLKEEK